MPENALTNFILHFRSLDTPLFLKRRDKKPLWNDIDLHKETYRTSPELYALSALDEKVLPSQRARILFQLLSASWHEFSKKTQKLYQRVLAIILPALPADDVIQVFLALRRIRANRSHTSKTILRYMLNHPSIEDMLKHRRSIVIDILEHALGKNVARACAKYSQKNVKSAIETKYLQKHLFRFAKTPQRTQELFSKLYKANSFRKTSKEPFSNTHLRYQIKEKPNSRPKTVTATNRGDISATLVHMYRGGSNKELENALQNYVETLAKTLPSFEGRLAIVLDASASMESYGERRYAYLSQAVAFQMCLEKTCSHIETWMVGGSNTPPRPEGETDLAMTLLNALEGNPELVVIISDGYENAEHGDLEIVVASLRKAGITTPIVFCHSKFTHKDTLTLRRPVTNLPELSFWHEEEFHDICCSLFSFASEGKGGKFFYNNLLTRLSTIEQRQTTWYNIG